MVVIGTGSLCIFYLLFCAFLGVMMVVCACFVFFSFFVVVIGSLCMFCVFLCFCGRDW